MSISASSSTVCLYSGDKIMAFIAHRILKYEFSLTLASACIVRRYQREACEVL